mgnify:CR=1 FL=1
MSFTDITKSLAQLKDFITNFFSFFNKIFDIFPNPINGIMKGAFILIVAWAIIKIVRG